MQAFMGFKKRYQMKLFRITTISAILFFSLYAFTGCKKVKEDIGKQFIVGIMTDGRWVVETFTENGTDDITNTFTGYEFQFTADGKVYGYYGEDKQTGTWSGNTTDLTITSDFPVSTDPVKKLNGTWKISKNTKTSLEATPYNSSRVAFLKLVKKS